jgi:hypothetical protein
MKTFHLWPLFIEGYKSGMDIGLIYGGTVFHALWQYFPLKSFSWFLIINGQHCKGKFFLIIFM